MVKLGEYLHPCCVQQQQHHTALCSSGSQHCSFFFCRKQLRFLFRVLDLKPLLLTPTDTRASFQTWYILVSILDWIYHSTLPEKYLNGLEDILHNIFLDKKALLVGSGATKTSEILDNVMQIQNQTQMYQTPGSKWHFHSRIKQKHHKD